MMQTHMSRYVLLVALVVMLWATETMAATIGFDGLTGPNLSSFNDRNVEGYVEDGFTVKATGGQWFEAHVFGNGVPAIGSGPVYSVDGGGASAITVTGGTFTFGGVDLTSNVAGGTSYRIAGFLANEMNPIFTQTVVIGGTNCSSNCNINTFYSINSTSTLTVDKLTITGTRPAGVTSFNIDNIRVTAAAGPGPPGPGPCTTPNCPDPNVPEPASLLLLGVGLAGIEIWRRNRGEG
jgi:PEP-CTERM motif